MTKVTSTSVAQATTTNTEVKKISKVMVDKAQRLADLRALIREADAEAKALRDEILAEAGIATTLIHHGLDVVRIAPRATTSVDTKKLEVEFPEVYSLVVKRGTTRVVDIIPR